MLKIGGYTFLLLISALAGWFGRTEIDRTAIAEMQKAEVGLISADAGLKKADADLKKNDALLKETTEEVQRLCSGEIR